MKACIVVDDWKLPIFRNQLAGAGYKYTDGGCLCHGTTLLTVETDNILKLKEVIESCQRDCAKEVRP